MTILIMEFILNLLSFLLTDTDIKEIKESSFTWYTIEEKIESDRLIDEESKVIMDFLDTLENSIK